MHLLLAQAMPTRPADPRLLAQLADGLVGRVHWAVGLVPQLAPFAAAALRAMDAVRSVQGAADLQQVHGDYHLGQVLHSPARGWVLLDFEGEPLRPLAERLEPDLALRDVAGMTRSFDYAAQHATVGQAVDDPGRVAATAWSAQAREAFLAGYARAGGHHSRADAELLRALELDKAMYETVYETLNRPGWVDIPMSAVRRLALAGADSTPAISAGSIGVASAPAAGTGAACAAAVGGAVGAGADCCPHPLSEASAATATMLTATAMGRVTTWPGWRQCPCRPARRTPIGRPSDGPARRAGWTRCPFGSPADR